MIFAKTGDEIEGIILLYSAGGALVFSGVRRMLKARRVEDTARNRIAHAPQGNVEIEGFAWCLNEPIRNTAGTYCAYYNCKLEELVRSGDHSYWETRWSFDHEAAFVSVDPTGSAIVFHKDAEIEADTRVTPWPNLLKTKSGNEIYKLVQSKYGTPFSTGGRSSNFRVVEEFIALGSPCYAQGNFNSSDRHDSKVTNRHLTVFFEYIKRRPPGEVHRNLRFDRDRDGKVTHHEVSGSLHSVAQNILKLELGSADSPHQLKSEPPKVHGCMRSDVHNKLIIAGMHEHHFVKRVADFNVVRILVGAILIAFGMVSCASFLRIVR